MSGKPDDDYVTAQICQDRHSATKWILGVLVALVAVFLTGAVYAINAANEAAHRAGAAATTLESHMATQEETEQHLKQRLDEIRDDVRENRALLQEILRNGRGQD